MEPTEPVISLNEIREVKNQGISMITQYVDAANDYYIRKFGESKQVEYPMDGDTVLQTTKYSNVHLWWTYCSSRNDDQNKHGSYFLVWGTNDETFNGSKSGPIKAVFLFKGTYFAFRNHMCTEENLDKWEKYILENV